MSSAADRAREKASRIAAGSQQRVPDPVTPKIVPEERPVPAVPRAARVKPVRMTLDLAPALHADFDDWTTRVTRQLGRGRVVRADVLRVLVRQLLEDEALQQRVVAALQREGRG
jgi:hypothetical protein